jgi:hypothetical protein
MISNLATDEETAMDIKGAFGNRVFQLLRNSGVAAIVVLALAVVSAVSVFGQSATGTLTGTVTDPKGLAMVGVNVTVHNVDTGTDMRPVTTNDSGIYQVPLLPPGTYDVTAAQTGFASLQSKGVVVQVGSTVRLDIEMQLAGTQSLVTVTAETPLLETEKTEQSQNVSENLVSNLPISSRRWEQFRVAHSRTHVRWHQWRHQLPWRELDVQQQFGGWREQ